MRMLLVDAPAKYKHFQHVQVVLLPPCSPADIDELEARLQIMPEGKAEYSWVDLALMFRQRRDSGWSEDKISTIYEKSPSKIKESISMLEEAERYLEDRDKPYQYSQVIKKEFAFRQLVKKRRGIGADEQKKILATVTSYTMLDSPDTAGGRLYDSIPAAIEYIDAIAENLITEFPEVKVDDTEAEDTSVDILTGGKTAAISVYDKAAAILKTEEYLEKARDIIQDTIEEQDALKREKDDADFCISQIQKANTQLQNAKNALEEWTEVKGIEETLNSITQTVTEIREWLDAHREN
jgi:hypothetical protein